jgi:hypothetical protein
MPNNMRNAYKIGGSSSAKKKKKKVNNMKRYDMGGTGMGGFTSSIDGMRDLTPQAMAMDTMAAAGGLEMFKDNGGSVLDPVQGMMKKGGAVKKKKKKQGYNSRLNESLGMRNGKKKQSMKSRRDESKGAKKAAGKRAYSGNRSSGRKK